MALNDIVVNLISKTDGFEKGMTRAQKMLKSFVGGMKGLGVAAATTSAALASAAAGGFAYMTKSSFESLDATAKLATQIGITGQTLREYQAVAAKSGVENEEFAETMKEMNMRIGEAFAEGGGSAFEAFQQLGLDAAQLQAMGPDKALLAIADAISQVDSSAQQLQLADKMFGDAGKALLPMLREGSDGINRMRESYVELAGTMSPEDFKAIENANDSTRGLWTSIKSVADQFAAYLAPAVQAVSEMMTEWLTDTVKNTGDVRQQFGTVSGLVGLLGDTITSVYGAWKGAQSIVTAALWTAMQPLRGILNALEGIASFAGIDLDLGASTLNAISDDLAKLSNEQWEAAGDAFQSTFSDELRSRTDQIIADNKAAAEKELQNLQRLGLNQNFGRIPATADEEKPVKVKLDPKDLEDADLKTAPDEKIVQAIDARSMEGVQFLARATMRNVNDPEKQAVEKLAQVVEQQRETNNALNAIRNNFNRRPVKIGFAG
ncbi:MAG: hypothetical protein HUJ26_19000 [Planctomycetaceae bacterium]|nr:hypothetical protein [Planctomycetaceae bacterium]